jgi:uncharacterized protein (DUF3084 family)
VALGLFGLFAAATSPPVPAAEREATRLVEARGRMVLEQLQSGDRGITNARVLAAMRKAPRHELVPERVRAALMRTRPCPLDTARPFRNLTSWLS